MKDKGFWAVVQADGRVFIGSNDYTHDVWLKVCGDFKSKNQELKYAQDIAERLNKGREVRDGIILVD